MNIYTGYYKGLNCYFLENEAIRLTVLPELGAKIASLVYKPQNFEVFSQPADGEYRLACYGASFADYDTSGADDMFPTIDACIYPYSGYLGRQLPDHGELWSLHWTAAVADKTLITEVRSEVLYYVFARSISLNGSTVQMKYKVVNTGVKSLYGLWAFHGLAACDELTRLILPGVDSIMTVHDSEILGPVGTRRAFPVTADMAGREYRLDKIGPQTAGKTEKFYVDGAVKHGEAALTLNKGRLEYRLIYPIDIVPYLGVWLNQGGFKGEYNCALEPSTGYYDSLVTAHKLDSICPIAPGETREWHLNIKLCSCQ